MFYVFYVLLRIEKVKLAMHLLLFTWRVVGEKILYGVDVNNEIQRDQEP